MVGCAIVVACTDLSTNVIKHAVKRYRPTHNLEIKDRVRVVNDYHGGKYGFFSAHAANTFGAITFIFFSVHWVDKKYRLLFFLFPLIVIYSRLYLGVHYPSDILTGIISGLFFGRVVFVIMNKHFLKLHEQKV
jgi:undecaprenyl-diphosphatase